MPVCCLLSELSVDTEPQIINTAVSMICSQSGLKSTFQRAATRQHLKNSLNIILFAYCQQKKNMVVVNAILYAPFLCPLVGRVFLKCQSMAPITIEGLAVPGKKKNMAMLKHPGHDSTGCSL